MPITSISYNRTYAIGPFLNEKIGVEISLDENQCPLEALAEAKKITDQFHLDANPNMADQNTAPIINEPLPEIQVEKPIEQILSIEDDIRSFTNYDKLGKVYGMLAKVQPDIAAVYNEMREKLKAAEIKDILDRTDALYKAPSEELKKEMNAALNKKQKTNGK